MPEPGWVRDPSGRYHQRFFDGTKWTDHVADEYGRRGIDPVEAIQREAATAGGTSAGPPAPALAAAGAALGPRRATPSSGIEVATIVAAAGGFVALISFVFLPWLDGMQPAGDINLLRSGAIALAGSGAAIAPFGVWESSFFDAGWIVSLVAAAFTVYALATGSAGRRARPILTAIIAICVVWAVVSTVMLRDWAGGLAGVSGGGSVSFDYGFFVGVAGLLALTVAPLLPERRLGGR